MMIAGALHPPFSLFLSAEKEKTGRARSKREKDSNGGCGGRGARHSRDLDRKVFARGVVLAGVLVVVESTCCSFRWRCMVPLRKLGMNFGLVWFFERRWMDCFEASI